MQLIQDLLITYSNQSARELRQRLKHPLDKVTTLAAFAQEFFEKNSFKMLIDPAIATTFLYHIIKNEEIKYFDFINEGSETLDLLYDYILKVNASKSTYDQLLEGDKLCAVSALHTAYKDFKDKYNLVDYNDILLYTIKNFENIDFTKYQTIYVDRFELNGVKFYKSALEKTLLEKLNEIAKNLSYPLQEQTTAQLYKLPKLPFDINNEIQSALRLARKLLQKNNTLKTSDICIVTSDITEYALIFRLYLDKYDLKGFDSKGKPLNLFNTTDTRVKSAFEKITLDVAQIKQRAQKYGLKIDVQTLKEKLIHQSYILEDKIGLELTEANQLLGSEKRYKHIIFIGADINHFPPTQSDNFLYDSTIAQNHFCQNSYYESSLLQYKQLKNMAENLYILYPQYQEKRKLAPSIIIDTNITNIIDISDVVPKKKKIKNSEYLESIQSSTFTKYDGLDVTNISAKHLSASQLNAYTKCPLRYLYINKLRLTPPKLTTEGLDFAQEGILMHACFEQFSKRVQGKKDLCVEEMKVIMLEVLEEEYIKFLNDPNNEIKEENIYHKIFRFTLAKGLNNELENGFLAKFVEYYDEQKEELNYFINSTFEKEFTLDHDLKPYERTKEDDRSYFIRGFIDRLDLLPNYVNIVDYKSKKVKNSIDKDKLKEIEEFKDFQLGLYTLYASQKYKKDIDAFLLSFKTDQPYSEFARVSNNESFVQDEKGKMFGVFYDEEYENNLKENIYAIQDKIEQGDFRFDNSDEKHCEYCDIRFMCSQSILNKGNVDEHK